MYIRNIGVKIIIEFIVELLASAGITVTTKSKLEKNIDKLRNEKWFSSLIQDARYEYVIWNNRKVKRILVKVENVDLFIGSEQEREKFINLVKQEHKKFVGIT
jgi:hypothetical protein